MQETLDTLNWIDLIVIGIIGLSVLIGLARGFVLEAMSLLTWVAAIIIGIVYCEEASVWFTAISVTSVRILLSFILLVLATLILGGVISHLIGRVIKSTRFSVTDRIIGTLFGFARGTMIVAVIALGIHSTNIAKENDAWKSSTLIPHFEPIALWVKDKFPDDFFAKLMPSDKSGEQKTPHIAKPSILPDFPKNAGEVIDLVPNTQTVALPE
jgi:membrane protein required for colicin V production